MRIVLKEIKMYWHYLLITLVCMVIDRNAFLTNNSYPVQPYYMQLPPAALYSACSILSYIILVIQLVIKENINRLILGLSLFVSLASIGWLYNIPSVLYYYDNYAYILPYFFIIGVGLIAMFTQGSFIGVSLSDKRTLRIASFKLLIASILGLLLSFYTHIITFSLLPLAIYEWRLRFVLEGKSWNLTWKY